MFAVNHPQCSFQIPKGRRRLTLSGICHLLSRSFLGLQELLDTLGLAGHFCRYGRFCLGCYQGTKWLPPHPPPPTSPLPARCCSPPLPLGLSAPLFAQPPAPAVSPKLISQWWQVFLSHLTPAVPRRNARGQQRPDPKLPINFSRSEKLSQSEDLGMKAGAERRQFGREGKEEFRMR